VSEDVTSGHASSDLVGLLTGEASRDDTVAVARHLKECRDCTDELVDLVVAHGALASAVRSDRALADPSARTRGGTRRDASASPVPGSGSSSATDSETTLPPLPPLSVTPEAPNRARPPRRHRSLALAAAVAAVAAAVVFTATFVATQHQPSQPVVAQAPLQTLHDPGAVGGTVTVLAEGTTRHMIVRTADLRALSGQEFYEVWLLDPATLKMLPVGVLSPSGNGDYEVSAGLMAGYAAVDVSLQRNDGNPAHSQTSVLRASL
jgi:hypothetical protein